LLWIDGGAGAVVGVVVLVLMGWLSALYRLPLELVRFMGLMNLVYGTYSLTLASRRRRPSWSIVLLVVANSAWAFACVWWSMLHWSTASVLGQVQLLGEALFVGALAAIEWRYRRVLVGAAQRSPEYGFGSL
jgi:hypothetical protein